MSRSPDLTHDDLAATTEAALNAATNALELALTAIDQLDDAWSDMAAGYTSPAIAAALSSTQDALDMLGGIARV